MQSSSAKPRAIWLSATVLLAGAIALGLAAIPPIISEKPFGLWREEPPPPQPAQLQGGLNFKLGKLEVNVGGKRENPPPLPPPPNPTRWFFVWAVALALPAIVVGAIAWQRESQHALAGTGMFLGVLAITWQYLIVGIAIGVAAAIILILLSSAS